MATAIVMPKLGNTVESSIIVRWQKQPGDAVSAGDSVCEIETDKATMEVESPVAGTLLAQFFGEGEDVPVMINIAVVGAPGEDFASLRPAGAGAPATPSASATAPPAAVPAAPVETPQSEPQRVGISPRARHLAERKGMPTTGLAGSGPGGRIIERDVQAALEAQPRMTPLARSMVASGDFVAPPTGSGAGGRITTRDLQPAAPAPAAQPLTSAAPASAAAPVEDLVEVLPVRGTRKIIAERMLASMQTTAQLTLDMPADARALQEYRKQLKASSEALGLQKVTINDLVLLAVSRTLPQFPDLNALFTGDSIAQHRSVHLGFAVDTPRGLIVPVIRHADRLSLKEISREARRLADACQNGKITPDELSGGTFTVTNLGSLGVEHFTPILNPPQVAILGVGSIHLKPVEDGEGVAFVPHIALSLTINHQVVDGAPGARFLQALSRNLSQIHLLLAL
ncbi:MAG: 2-oxo acid dehydrogenase subunit E2 [Anaerolineae bacterium]|nr:2-oxo acid dehydrogenase subunit E2 [Anaerolineae bacterium]